MGPLIEEHQGARSLKLAAVVASPSEGRTSTVVDAVVDAAVSATRFEVERFLLGMETPEAVTPRLAAADCFVIGTPIYRATYSGLLKCLLDETPRGIHDRGPSVFAAKPVVVVATGATEHHFLGIDPLLSILVRFFSAYVVPPAFYADHTAFDADGSLLPVHAATVRALGRTLAALSGAIASSPVLRGPTPQI